MRLVRASIVVIVLSAGPTLGAATRALTLSGFEPSPAVSARSVSLAAEGDFKGTLSLKLDSAAGKATGTFVIHVLEASGDELTEVGTLEGEIAGGTIAADADGFLTEADLVLNITSGSGRHSAATGSGRATASRSGKELKGSLSVSF